jgi:hypothetical protein
MNLIREAIKKLPVMAEAEPKVAGFWWHRATRG